MKRFQSKVVTSSDEFQNNYKDCTKMISDLRKRMASMQTQGSTNRIKLFRKNNKLLGRERVQLVLDQDSPFLEIGALMGYAQDDSAEGSTMVGGIGLVCGVECMIVAHVPTVGAGMMSRGSGAKWHRCYEISMANRLPFIFCVESAGADLTKAFEAFHSYPNMFYSMANHSKAQIPLISIVFGTCIAGGAYMAGMADYVIMIKGQSTLALAGTKLTKMATGEDSTEEELGGATMHSKVSGVSDFVVNNENEAIAKAREIVSSFNNVKKKTVYEPEHWDALPEVPEPAYDPDEILGIVSTDWKKFYNVREIIARVVDGSKFAEFKPDWGTTIVTCWARIHGYPVGIIANNGVIFPETAQKATHFMNICNQRGIPIVFFHNVTGFIVGKTSEAQGMIKWGALMVNAASTASVPRLSVLIGGSFGAANFAMCGKGFSPSFIWSWPTSKCAVMGPDQLSGVMEMLARENTAKKGKAVDEQKVAMATKVLKDQIETEMDAYYLSSHNIDDGVIDPRETRNVLGMCLSVVCDSDIQRASLEGVCRL